MNYTKPQVADLGKAVRVIEQFGKPIVDQLDGSGQNPPRTLSPAYDLDE
jgi:hypothetical protein